MDRERLITVGITLVGLAQAVSVLPQALRIVRRRSSSDVSLVTFGILGLGQLCWIAYGLHRGDGPIVLTNCVAATLSALTVGIALRFR
ncbi:MAG TPA: SemiSWEET family transporter [Planctomycetota bacterium]|nr:SemiSWEET family transporter [Planctomycetota bacterium]